jgi:hypothetical protein
VPRSAIPAALFAPLLPLAPDPLHAAALRVLAHVTTDRVWRVAARRAPDWQSLETAGLFDSGHLPGEGLPLSPVWAHPWWPNRSALAPHALVLGVPIGPEAPVSPAILDALLTGARAHGYRPIGVLLWPLTASIPSPEPWPVTRARLQQTAATWASQVGLPIEVDPWGDRAPVPFPAVAAQYRAREQGPLARTRLTVGWGVTAAQADWARTATFDQPVFVLTPSPSAEVPALPRAAWAIPSPLGAVHDPAVTFPSESGPAPVPGVYAWRDDLPFALSEWADRVPAEALQDAGHRWRQHVEAILTRAVAPHRLERVSPEIQEAWLDRMARRRRVLNLDPVTHCAEALQLGRSRRFALGGAQVHPVSHDARPSDDGQCLPGTPAALAHLPAGAYWLVDDDIRSGATMAALRAALPARVRVRGQVSLLDAVRRGDSTPLIDRVNLRDFLPGARDAGLVLTFPSGEEGRLPHLAPFVRLTVHATVHPAREAAVSDALWEAAARFFEALPVPLCVRDGGAAFQSALAALGEPPDRPLAVWCRAMRASLG